MIDKIEEIVKKLHVLSDPHVQLKVLEDILIAKYGSYEAAQRKVFKLREQCQDEDEFNQELVKLTGINAFEHLIEPYRDSKLENPATVSI